MSLSPKKLILLGLGVMLLIAIPLTVFLVQKQQEIRSSAAPATSVSLQPASKTASVDENVSFDIMVNPGQAPNNNAVGLVALTLNFDPTKLEIGSSGVVIDKNVLPNEFTAPTVSANSISFINDVGIDPSKTITTTTKIGTITFKAIAVSSEPTTISFDSSKSHLLAFSSEGNLTASDENVVLPNGYGSATVTISGASSITPTPTRRGGTPTPTTSPGSPTPTSSVPVPTTAVPTPTTASIPVPTTPPGTGSGNQVPVCSSLVLDKSAVGTVPYAITFTVAGTDSNGTLNKASFSFGDGTIQEVTEGGGIGTNSVNTGLSHTYSTTGTFTATATLTDNSGGVSNSCTQVITVSSGIAEVPPPVAPTVAPAGPAETLIGIGGIGIIFSIIGGALLLIL